MRVLVTGGAGRIGQAVITDLLNHGHEVVSVDRRRPAERETRHGVRFVEMDIGHIGQVAGAMAGCAAVIHLGAIPSPYSHADEVVFRNNVVGTFAVLQAATLLGLRKAAIASSLSALGSAWAPQPFAPRYAPVDEDHPLLVHDCYGLSKEVDERTAEMFHRRTGMQVAALRFSWVLPAAEIPAVVERYQADPGFEDAWKGFWAYVEVGDAASACRLAIEAEGIGFAPFNIVAADTLASEPTEELIRRYCAETELRQPILGFRSAFSIERARRLLGWEPRFEWRGEMGTG